MRRELPDPDSRELLLLLLRFDDVAAGADDLEFPAGADLLTWLLLRFDDVAAGADLLT